MSDKELEDTVLLAIPGIVCLTGVPSSVQLGHVLSKLRLSDSLRCFHAVQQLFDLCSWKRKDAELDEAEEDA